MIHFFIVIELVARKKVLKMKRIQFYPEPTLDALLTKEASEYGVSVSALVNAKLSESYGLTKKNHIPLPQLTTMVIHEVEVFINDPANKGKIFDLHVSATYKNIEMTGNGKPKADRASIGTSFKKKVDNGDYPNVSIAYRPNGKKRLSANNAMMYEII